MNDKFWSEIGVASLGIRMPFIKDGDEIVQLIVDQFTALKRNYQLQLTDKDVVAVTESLVARAQRNYVSFDQIGEAVDQLFAPDGETSYELTIVFPIMSRNRFAHILTGITRAKLLQQVTVYLKYPHDEQGNALAADVSRPFDSDFYLQEAKHEITGVNYAQLYEAISPKVTAKIAPSLAVVAEQKPAQVLVATVHSRHQDQAELQKLLPTARIHTLADLCAQPTTEHGYNEEYGVLGSNVSNDERIKLFPRDGQTFVKKLQTALAVISADPQKPPQVLIYGDGAYKDPSSGIWELADPVVSPAFTEGLVGSPCEVKLKHALDSGLSDQEIKTKVTADRQNKTQELGTTPRRYVDLIGSLADLTSGSGDRGTPVILIRNYFSNYFG